MNRPVTRDDFSGVKIVLLIGYFGRGGSQKQAYLLSRRLHHFYGANVEVWALTCGGDYEEDFESAGIRTRALEFEFPRCPVRAVSLFYWIQLLRRFRMELKKAKVDILLPFTTWPNVVAGLTYRWAGVRLCVWGERSAGSERVKGFEKLAVKQFRRFVANSSAGIEFLARDMNVPRDRISFVPNGFEEPMRRLGIDWRERMSMESGQLLVVMVANITKFKDHQTLLRAWKIVQDAWISDPKPVLALAGEFRDTYEDCLRIADEAGLFGTVRFLGGISDVPGLLAICDLTVFSSPNEGMPNAVLECMAAGKAVIASDLPGVRDALGPYDADMLTQPGDAAELARKLLHLLRDAPLRKKLGDANRQRILSEFSVDKMAGRFAEIICNEGWMNVVPSASQSDARPLCHGAIRRD
jgi:glycosyltransferase involved in cell wall biosynthesis